MEARQRGGQGKRCGRTAPGIADAPPTPGWRQVAADDHSAPPRRAGAQRARGRIVDEVDVDADADHDADDADDVDVVGPIGS